MKCRSDINICKQGFFSTSSYGKVSHFWIHEKYFIIILSQVISFQNGSRSQIIFSEIFFCGIFRRLSPNLPTPILKDVCSALRLENYFLKTFYELFIQHKQALRTNRINLIPQQRFLWPL